MTQKLILDYFAERLSLNLRNITDKQEAKGWDDMSPGSHVHKAAIEIIDRAANLLEVVHERDPREWILNAVRYEIQIIIFG